MKDGRYPHNFTLESVPSLRRLAVRASIMAQWQRIQLPSRRRWFNPWVRKIHWRRKWQPILVFLPVKSQGQMSLVGYSLWGGKRVRRNLATEQQQQHIHCSSIWKQLNTNALNVLWARAV